MTKLWYPMKRLAEIAWRLLVAKLRERPKLAVTPVQAGSLAALVAILFGIVAQRAARLRPQRLVPISLSATVRLLNEQRVQELIYREGGALLLRLKPGMGLPDIRHPVGTSLTRFSTHLVPGSEAEIFKRALEVPELRFMQSSRTVQQVFSAVLPFVFIAVWYKVVKSLLSKDEKYTPSLRPARKREATTFADVASRCKVELAEIVDYLNRPAKYKQAGARLPRGALLVGPSGTGKTLLARAVAGEANCAFISSSASEFVEVYVGRGAARVRDLFRQAREAAPSILFIDELDALGNRHRDGPRAQNEEYVQLLNQILTEMDGFHGRSDGVVVIGATNRHEAIDPALLRPGRFDRHIFVELPAEDERLEILSIHARRAPVFSQISASELQQVARATEGFSGAELSNVINEAVFLALRKQLAQAGSSELAAALDRQKATRQRGSSNAENYSNASGLSRAFLTQAWSVATTAP